MKTNDTTGVHIWLVLSRAARSVEEHAKANIEALGLGVSDFAVLEALLHKGPLPINTLGRKVLLASGSMTPAVDRLERRGLVRRRESPGDRRVRVIELTKEGSELIERAFPEHAEALEKAVSALGATERATIVRLLKKLGKGAQALLEQDEEEEQDDRAGEAREGRAGSTKDERPATTTKARKR